MKKIHSVFIVCFLASLLTGCAFDVVRLKQIPTRLKADLPEKSSFTLEKEAPVDLDTGYSRILKKGTRWVSVGAISQGDVFKTCDQILTVEGSNIHEAYIVMNSSTLVGFYLPVEKTYSPLKNSVELMIKKMDNP